MPSKILDGKALAQLAEEDIKSHVSTLKENGITPTLATILVGVDPASATYVKMKQNACARLGMDSIAVELSKETTTEELLEAIEKLNQDSNVHGILLQHPVPSQINERECFDAINVEKDVDGVTCIGFGQMTMGERHLVHALQLASCASLSIIKLKFLVKMQLLLVEVLFLENPWP
jgi:methylenetetrahydrofolate dehydrogenase (NADP+)/methenyltetrahydrofolate cyclohydrolase